MTITDQMEIRDRLRNRQGDNFEVIAHEGKLGKISFQSTGELSRGSGMSTWMLKNKFGVIIFDDSKIKMLGGVNQTIIRLELL